MFTSLVSLKLANVAVYFVQHHVINRRVQVTFYHHTDDPFYKTILPYAAGRLCHIAFILRLCHIAFI